MEKPLVSLFASAARPKDWVKFLDSLKDNTIPYEVIFAGPNKPTFDLSKYPEFKYIEAACKPAQCYQISANYASGLLCGWSTDDATYSLKTIGLPQKNLDKAYKYYKDANSKKAIVSMHTIEDGRDVWHQHRFFGKWNDTPIMAPMALMNRELFFELGGYDRNFISGQGENDIIMRVYGVGGTVIPARDAYVYIHHRECHIGLEHKSMLRQYYVADRQVLEDAWVKEGYGCYGPAGTRLKPFTLSKTRLKTVESFEDKEDITTKTQGPKGEAEINWK